MDTFGVLQLTLHPMGYDWSFVSEAGEAVHRPRKRRVPLSPAVLAGLSAGGLAVVGSYWAIGLAATAPGRRIFRRSLLSRVGTERPVVALTFDDGPDPEYTERILDALGEARATFFLLGERARRWPSVARRIRAEGHEAACHGYTHRRLTRLSPWATVEEIRTGRAAVEEVVGAPPRFFRPAHGLFNLAAWAAVPRLGMRRTLWSGSARDWEQDATPESIAGRVLEASFPGAIILLHDSGGLRGRPAATLGALPAILSGLRERRLQPVTLSELVPEVAGPG